MNSAPVIPSLAQRAATGAQRALPWLIILALLSGVLALMPLLNAARSGESFPGADLLLKAGWYLNPLTATLVVSAAGALVLLIMLDRVFLSKQARANRKSHEDMRKLLIRERTAKNQAEWESISQTFERAGAVEDANPHEPSASELTREARAALEAGEFGNARRLAQSALANAMSIEDKSQALNELGDACAALGEFQAAERAFRSCLDIFEAPDVLDRNNSDLMRAIAAVNLKIADVRLKIRKFDSAKEAFQASLSICADLHDKAPDNQLIARDYSIALEGMGNLMEALGDPLVAVTSYRQSFPIVQKLSEQLPSDWQAQQDVWITCDRLGDLELQVSDVENACKTFQLARKAAQSLRDMDPSRHSAQLNFATSSRKLADTMCACASAQESLSIYSEGAQIYRDLLGVEPANLSWLQSLADLLDHQGQAALSISDVHTARQAFEESLLARTSMADLEPPLPDAASQLAQTRVHLAKTFQDQQDTGLALEHLLAAQAGLKTALESNPEDLDMQASLDAVTTHIQDLRGHRLTVLFSKAITP
jgi:tetratricopeptide (TPR) repeat protein